MQKTKIYILLFIILFTFSCTKEIENDTVSETNTQETKTEVQKTQEDKIKILSQTEVKEKVLSYLNENKISIFGEPTPINFHSERINYDTTNNIYEITVNNEFQYRTSTIQIFASQNGKILFFSNPIYLLDQISIKPSTLQEIQENILDYLETNKEQNFDPIPDNFSINNIYEIDGMYKLNINVNLADDSYNYDAYTTHNGALLFSNGIIINDNISINELKISEESIDENIIEDIEDIENLEYEDELAEEYEAIETIDEIIDNIEIEIIE